jgi:hypothetical protein
MLTTCGIACRRSLICTRFLGVCNHGVATDVCVLSLVSDTSAWGRRTLCRTAVLPQGPHVRKPGLRRWLRRRRLRSLNCCRTITRSVRPTPGLPVARMCTPAWRRIGSSPWPWRLQRPWRSPGHHCGVPHDTAEPPALSQRQGEASWPIMHSGPSCAVSPAREAEPSAWAFRSAVRLRRLGAGKAA